VRLKVLNTALNTNKVQRYKSKSENRPRIKTNKRHSQKVDKISVEAIITLSGERD